MQITTKVVLMAKCAEVWNDSTKRKDKGQVPIILGIGICQAGGYPLTYIILGSKMATLNLGVRWVADFTFLQSWIGEIDLLPI